MLVAAGTTPPICQNHESLLLIPSSDIPPPIEWQRLRVASRTKAVAAAPGMCSSVAPIDDDVVWYGVAHNDLRLLNLLWNGKRQRVMIIDFDRATLCASARHKLVARLRGSRAKR